MLGTGSNAEAFSLWSGSLDAASPGEQVMYNMWVYLLKQSLASNVPVTITIASTGSPVQEVMLGNGLVINDGSGDAVGRRVQGLKGAAAHSPVGLPECNGALVWVSGSA
jgi:hypothetical protein